MWHQESESDTEKMKAGNPHSIGLFSLIIVCLNFILLHNYQPLQGEISEGFQPGAAEENLHSFDSVPEVHLTVLLE